jgi:putative endonuclease
MYCVYILKSEQDGSLYIGKTNDLPRRMAEHNGGHTPSIRANIPYVLLERIDCTSEAEARVLEKEYKKGYKREELRRKYGLKR